MEGGQEEKEKQNGQDSVQPIHNTSGALLREDEKGCAARLLVVFFSHHLGEGIKVSKLQGSNWIRV